MKEFKKMMLIVIIALATVTLFTSCESEPLTDNDISNELVGVWEKNVLEGVYIEMTLTSKGEYLMHQITINSSGSSNRILVRNGVWQSIEDSLFLDYTDIQNNNQQSQWNGLVSVNELTLTQIGWNSVWLRKN